MAVRFIEYRPPRIAQLFLLIAAVLHGLTPLGQWTIYSNRFLAIILGISGLIVMMWGWWLFKCFNTAVCPTAKTEHLVTSGIYRITRNPMYLGLTAMLLGLALYVGSLPFYLATAAFFVVINTVFCPYEESKLMDTFGDEYLYYQQAVRRWL